MTDHFRSSPRAPENVLRKRRQRTKALGAVCLVLGIILFVPGLTEPYDFSLLLPGAFGITAGLISLLRRQKKNPFAVSARKLLLENGQAPEGPALQAVFSPEGMALTDGTPSAQRKLFPYSEFACVLECEDIFLAVYIEKMQWKL